MKYILTLIICLAATLAEAFGTNPIVASPWTTTTNPVTALAALGGSSGGGGMTSVTNNGVIWSFALNGQFTFTNTATGAWGMTGTNGHVKFIDQYGDEYHQTTNSLQSQVQVAGVKHTLLWTNATLYIDGAVAVTNGQTGVTLGGTFTGSLSGNASTATSAATVTGPQANTLALVVTNNMVPAVTLKGGLTVLNGTVGPSNGVSITSGVVADAVQANSVYLNQLYSHDDYGNNYQRLNGNGDWLNEPGQVIVGEAGNLYYANTSNLLLGYPLTDTQGTLYYANNGMLADPTGQLYYGISNNLQTVFIDYLGALHYLNGVKMASPTGALFGTGSSFTNTALYGTGTLNNAPLLTNGAAFSGNGSGLTNIPYAAGFNSTNGFWTPAVTATGATNWTFTVTNVNFATVLSAGNLSLWTTLTPAQYAALIGTNTFTGSNTFSGVVTAQNAANQISGTFSGNGGGLTNLNVSSQRIFYLATNGNDVTAQINNPNLPWSGNLSSNSAWISLANRPGDTIHLLPGNYPMLVIPLPPNLIFEGSGEFNTMVFATNQVDSSSVSDFQVTDNDMLRNFTWGASSNQSSAGEYGSFMCSQEPNILNGFTNVLIDHVCLQGDGMYSMEIRGRVYMNLPFKIVLLVVCGI